MANGYKILRIVLLGLSVIGLVLYIVAFALPKWSKYTDGNEGLWQVCFINGGKETCSTWTDNLLTGNLKIIQILSCLGLAFYAFFVFAAAISIFWTNHWKKAKFIKYSTAIFAVFVVVFLAICVVLYEGDKKSSTVSLTMSWYLTIVGAAIAGILAPFYLIDACRTVEPKKPDREKLFGKIDSLPPMPAPTTLPNKNFDNEGLGEKPEGKNTRPPLLSTLRRQHTTFVHPPPKPSPKKLTTKDIKAFPLPPSKTKMNLFEKDEVEDHPTPIPVPATSDKNGSEDTMSQVSIPGSSVTEDSSSGIFKFHKTKTVHKGGKTFLKIQNSGENLPPVMMVMPGVDTEESDDETPRKRPPKNDLMEQWEQEQARRKFAPYFIDAIKMPLREKSELSPSERLQQKFKKKIDSLNNSEPSDAAKKRINETSSIYMNDDKHKDNDKKSKKNKKSKKEKKSSTKTADNDERSLKSQTGVTIYNDLGEDEA